MLKTEAEQMIERAMEETGATFTAEQKAAMAIAILKIAGRLVEEAVSSSRPNAGGRSSFFSE